MQALMFPLKVELKWLRNFSAPDLLTSLASEPEKLPCYTVFISLFTNHETFIVKQTLFDWKLDR